MTPTDYSTVPSYLNQWLDDATENLSMTTLHLPSAWQSIADPFLRSPKAATLSEFLLAEEASGQVLYPPAAQRFAALEVVKPNDVKVVILGQDPYHGPGQAMGLSFSVPQGVAMPPSLLNIYKELNDDIGFVAPGHG